MTRLETVKFTTRLICAWLIYNAGTDFLAVVRSGALIFSGVYSALDGVRPSRGMSAIYAGEVVVIVEFTCNVLLAIIFYRCGPRLVKFFLGEATPPTEDVPETIEAT